MTAGKTTISAGRAARLWLIFAAALAIRWGYVLAIHAMLGAQGLQGVDSISFLIQAEHQAAAFHAGGLSGWGWVGSNTIVMPLFVWILTACHLIAGSSTALAYVLLQGILDAGTCVLVYRLAATFNPAFAMPAAVAAVINPTQIVLSGLVYNDTPFLLFATLALLAALWWLQRPAFSTALLLGVALGAAALTRVMIVPAIPVLLVFLLAALAIMQRLRRAHLGQLAAAAVIAALCLAPTLIRNAKDYDAWSLTSQGGQHLAFWIVPLVQEAKDGTPWSQGYEAMQQRVKARYPTMSGNPFLHSAQLEAVGREEITALGVGAMAKAWLLGAAINLASPALVLSPIVSALPRTGFYATQGASTLEKIRNFLFATDNALYAWILITGIAGLIVMRCVQLAGLPGMLRSGHWPGVLLLGGWCVYVLLVNGPIASPKYRLPMESTFALLTGAGFIALRRLVSRSRQ